MKNYLMESALIESKSIFNEFDIVNSYLIEVDYLTESEAVDVLMLLETQVEDFVAKLRKGKEAKIAKIHGISTKEEAKALKWQKMKIGQLSDSGVNMSAPSTKAKVERIKVATKNRIASIRTWASTQITKANEAFKKAVAAARTRFNSVRGNISAKLKKAPVETGVVKNAGKAPSVGQRISGAASKAAGALKGKGGKYAAGAAGAAVVGYGGAKLYKNYLSKAARACAGKTGEEKAKCMAKFRTEAAKVRLEYLKSSLDKCKGTGDPDLCKKMIKEQIDLKLK